MRNTKNRILAALLLVGLVSGAAYGITNPLKTYDLYADTRLPDPKSDGTREQVMSEYYSNSLAAKRLRENREAEARKQQAKANSSTSDNYINRTVERVKRRNEILRESSKEVHANSDPAGWESAPSFYPNPQLSSIISKYRKSNFAGCLQESISYVKIHPNDTLGYYYMAMSYAKVNDKENAIKAYEKVIKLNNNPMIVKYATNGRNCVINPDASNCYQNVNVPDYYYPYADALANGNLTPIDPNELILKNLTDLQSKIPASTDLEGMNLPFGDQNEALDNFINAPYGNGLAPELNSQYKETQLKKILETINNENNDLDATFRNMKNIKTFDSKKY